MIEQDPIPGLDDMFGYTGIFYGKDKSDRS